jgi:hypothetical protein
MDHDDMSAPNNIFLVNYHSTLLSFASFAAAVMQPTKTAMIIYIFHPTISAPLHAVDG